MNAEHSFFSIFCMFFSSHSQTYISHPSILPTAKNMDCNKCSHPRDITVDTPSLTTQHLLRPSRTTSHGQFSSTPLVPLHFHSSSAIIVLFVRSALLQGLIVPSHKIFAAQETSNATIFTEHKLATFQQQNIETNRREAIQRCNADLKWEGSELERNTNASCTNFNCLPNNQLRPFLSRMISTTTLAVPTAKSFFKVSLLRHNWSGMCGRRLRGTTAKCRVLRLRENKSE